VFYLLHGVGQSYRINLAMVACIAWQPSESGNVAAEITFAGGAKAEMTVPDHIWSTFLDQIEQEDR
jgi:hypothetical protein